MRGGGLLLGLVGASNTSHGSLVSSRWLTARGPRAFLILCDPMRRTMTLVYLLGMICAFEWHASPRAATTAF